MLTFPLAFSGCGGVGCPFLFVCQGGTIDVTHWRTLLIVKRERERRSGYGEGDSQRDRCMNIVNLLLLRNEIAFWSVVSVYRL